MFDTDNEQERSPKELITDLYKAFESFRRKMEDPSYIQIEGAIKQLMENQIEMKNDLSKLNCVAYGTATAKALQDAGVRNIHLVSSWDQKEIAKDLKSLLS